MKLIVTIDTEEDNWGEYDLIEYSTQNIEHVPELQELLDSFGVKPTYLVNYPVASDPRAILILKHLLQTSQCEIGMHCHSWNTPPLEETRSKRNMLLYNLPVDLQIRKLKFLHQTIIKNINTVPISFRGGQWGFSQEALAFLQELGYKIDTSVTPYTDWSDNGGPNYSQSSSNPYYFSPDGNINHNQAAKMLEVPATVGFTQKNITLSKNLYKFLQTPVIKRIRLVGILASLRLLNKVWLSPEQASSEEMIALTKRLMEKKVPLIILFFHSPSLQPGLTPFVRTKADKREFMGRLEKFFLFTKRVGIESIKLSDAIKMIPQP